LPNLEKTRNLVRRADAIGTFQSLVALWQIFLRQGQIPEAQADASLRSLIEALADARRDESIFDAGRAGVRVLLTATRSAENVSEQDRLIELLAGKPGPGEEAAHKAVLEKLNTRFGEQRLVSVKDLFDLADHLERVSRGESFNVAMANRLAARISEVRLPRSNLSSEESNSFAQGHWVEKHIQEQRDLNLRRLVDRAQGRSENLLDIRGELAPILRDSLVGLVYTYYSPPAAELIRANPLFVRSHDFLGMQGFNSWRSSRLLGTGWPNSGGGRLVGSLNGLAYALAEAEQNFMIPSERQALIWQDLAPQILLGATVPRWWNVSAADQHFVGLHMRLGHKLLATAATDSALREQVLELLRRRVEPARLWRMQQYFQAGKLGEGIATLTPAELYETAADFTQGNLQRARELGDPFVSEIERLRQQDASRFNYDRMASLFGTPHPELSHSFKAELLHLPLFPTMMGYSSRILAESWESTNLYWAALADELHLSPAQLNLLVPQWTQESLERIFATHLDDWPALLRSMRIVGDRYRERLKPGVEQQVQAGWNDHANGTE
jgi:antitoxin (DNA-binding transcriptional repressor) of toxin-antitoxin stability system